MLDFLQEKYPGQMKSVVDKSTGMIAFTPNIAQTNERSMLTRYLEHTYGKAAASKIAAPEDSQPVVKAGDIGKNSEKTIQSGPGGFSWLQVGVMALGGLITLGGAATVVSSPVTVPLGLAVMAGGYYMDSITEYLGFSGKNEDNNKVVASNASNTAPGAAKANNGLDRVGNLPLPPHPGLRDVAGHAR
jgi:hypothetical protein